MKTFIFLLGMVLLAPTCLHAQTPGYWSDTTGKSYTLFAATPLAAASAQPMACGIQWGSVAAPVLDVFDDAGHPAVLQASKWDDGHRQGIALFTLPAGGKVFKAQATPAVNYVSIGCIPANMCTIDKADAQLGTSLALGFPSDLTVAFMVEDSVGSGDNFLPTTHFTLALNKGVDGFGAMTGSGDPSFSIVPAGNTTLIAAIAFRPPAPPSIVVPLPGAGTITFFITGIKSPLICTPTDDASCSISFEWTDANGNQLSGKLGTLTLVKTTTTQTQRVPLASVTP